MAKKSAIEKNKRRVRLAKSQENKRQALRAVARDVLPDRGQPGWDYVLIGRRDTTADRPFPQLLSDLRTALARIHGRDK